MATTNIDLNTLKTIMALFKPDPAAPFHTSQIDERISMAKDVSYMQVDIREIKSSIKDISDNHISKIEFSEHIATDTLAHLTLNKNEDDHESRIRILEASMWKLAGMSSIGSAVLTMVFAYLLKLVN